MMLFSYVRHQDEITTILFSLSTEVCVRFGFAVNYNPISTDIVHVGEVPGTYLIAFIEDLIGLC